MIKWLKKLVKGSDFVVTKKKISVIALDPRAGKSYGEDIAGLFSDVADISVFSMLDGSAAGVLERADLFVASTDAYGSPEELAKHIPLDSQTMAIEVSFRWSELRKLKELPAGSKVLFVNMTETMAREAIAQLEQFGITHIHWIPFYPGASLEEDVHIAVTPDEMRYVPPKMETVIDIGQRVCTSGMMIEIALRLGLESLLEGPAFQEYARSVATSNYSFDQMFARSVRLESLFHILLESLEDGVIGMGEVADPAECAKIAALGIDFLAAGIGNIHGIYPANWKGLDFEALERIHQATNNIPLVLHGGTGIPDEMVQKAIRLGVSKINVNTDCQLVFAEATRKYIEAGKDQQGKGYDPRKLLKPGADAIMDKVKEKIELFGSANKA